MKKLVNILSVVIILLITFIAWWKYYEFYYLDKCLDMWGWINPWNHSICVIEK